MTAPQRKDPLGDIKLVQSEIAKRIEVEETHSSSPLADRRLGALLFAFFFALYLLTASGHLYSPDGEFAFRIARSISTEPHHEYLVKQQKDLSQWGIMVPILSQPFIVLGAPISTLMPQMNQATVDGRDFTLGVYRKPNEYENVPTVGPREPGVEDVYTRTDLPSGPASSLALISFLALAKDVPQNTVVADVTITGTDGTVVTVPLRAGVETAEWSRGRDSPLIQHQMARVASAWAGNTAGRNFYADLQFGRSIEPKELRIRYLIPEGRLFVRSLAFIDGSSGSLRPVSSEYGFWSPRENEEYFALIFYAAYNALVTALTCLLLFAMARQFGYGPRVSALASLLYGLATVAWPYSKYDFTEPTLTLLVMSALYLIVRWGSTRRDSLLLGAAILALMAAVTKYVAAILIPVMAIQILLLHWQSYPSRTKLRGLVRPMLMFLAPYIALAFPAVLYLSTRFGYYPSIFEAWAGIQRGWLPLPFEIGLRGLLFSPGRSFFLYSPPAILALIGVIPFVRRHGVRAFGLLAIVLIYFAIYSKKVAWEAGAGWGPRYQVVIVPLVVLLAAYVIEKAVERRSKWAQYALLAVFVLGVGLQLLAVPKSFNNYLGIFRDRIVTQMPDKGAQYGGADYFPHAEGLSDHNGITATVWSWQFNPILAHGWLLAADALHLGRPYLKGYEDKLLGTPPWKLMGVNVMPDQPEHGLGLDFWSTRLFQDFPSSPALLAGILLVLLVLEAVIVLCGARLVAFLQNQSSLRTGRPRIWIIASVVLFLAFDAIHFLV